MLLLDVSPLDLEGVCIIKPKIYPDIRGYFIPSFESTLYEKHGFGYFVQDNHSFSKKGCIRGMHFQTNPKQAKLIQVIKGSIYDVFVDIRKNSPTYAQWGYTILDDKNHHQLFIPSGFAHGFCALTDADVLYKVSSVYDPLSEKGFLYNDPDVGIEWPTPNPILSVRDREALLLKEINL